MTTSSSPTISIRLPEAARRSLDNATKLTHRSRSFLMKEALDRHLAEIVQEQTRGTNKSRVATLLSFAGAGAKLGVSRSQEEIDAHIRWLRDNE
jgi:predicted transcriptional regulator